MKKQKITKRKTSLERLLDLQLESQKLPQLSPVEKAKLEQAFAIEQLYNSSKLEGSSLTTKMIDRAIYGKKLSAA
ncbi:MAG: hypothetical protein Q8L47_00530 [bacterium]|nr:hypothetical protein [bacterium]